MALSNLVLDSGAEEDTDANRDFGDENNLDSEGTDMFFTLSAQKLGPRTLAGLYDLFNYSERKGCLAWVFGQPEHYRLTFSGYLD